MKHSLGRIALKLLFAAIVIAWSVLTSSFGGLVIGILM